MSNIVLNKRILITAPNLNSTVNISGISAVVNEIFKYSNFNLIHFQVGKSDQSTRNYKRFVSILMSYFKFLIFIYRNKINIIHLNVPFEKFSLLRDIVYLIIGKIVNTRIVVHVHGGYYMSNICNNTILKIIIKTYLKFADTVIVLSLIESDFLSKYYSYKNAVVIPNSISIQMPPTKIEEIINMKKLQNILFFGRIDYNKGLQEIIHTLNRLVNDGLKFQFHVCGTGPDKERFIDSLNNSSINYIYHGTVSGTNKDEIFKKSYIFLLPSYYEGMPISLIEAMSYGCIVIASTVGSIPFVIQDNFNGMLVSPRSVDDLYFKTYLALENIEASKKIALNGYNSVYSNFNSLINIKKIDSVYSSL